MNSKKILPIRVGILFFGFSLFLPNQGIAAPLEVFVDKNTSQIFLQSADCDALREEYEAILVWSKSRGGNPTAVFPGCLATSGLIKVDISLILPKFVRDVYDYRPTCHGPNCWNAAMVDQGVFSVQPRFTDALEWAHALKENCVERRADEAPQPGDVVAIKEKVSEHSARQVHGFTYVKKLAFSKNGCDRGSPYLLHDLNEVLKLYEVGPSPSCSKAVGIPKEDCIFYVNFYHCSFSSSVATPHFHVKTVETQVSDCAMRGTPTSVLLESLEDKLKVIQQMISYTPHLHSFTTQDRMIVKSLEFQLKSIREQALEIAIRDKKRDEIQAIIDLYPNLNYGTEYESCPIVMAVRYGDVETAGLLAKRGVVIKVTSPDNKPSLLVLAVKSGNVEVVKFLLSQGVDPNEQAIWSEFSSDGNTEHLDFRSPVEIAAVLGHVEILQELTKNKKTRCNVGLLGMISNFSSSALDQPEVLNLIKKCAKRSENNQSLGAP